MGYPPYVSIVGHGVPAAFYFGFGSFFLGLTLKRCRDIDAASIKSADGRRLAYHEVYPAEKPEILRRGGIILMTCCTIGFLVESLGGVQAGYGFFFQGVHEVMYLSYLFVGAICHLESKKKIFPNAVRYAIALTFLTQFIIWHEHAMMKKDMASLRLHMLQAYINGAAFVAWAYSAYNPKSLFALVTGFALMAFNGTWLLTEGVSEYCWTVSMHMVGPVFVMEILAIVSIIIACTVFLLEPRREEWDEDNKDFSILSAEEGLRLKVEIA